jgi:hypothetical protein
MHLSSPAEE